MANIPQVGLDFFKKNIVRAREAYKIGKTIGSFDERYLDLKNWKIDDFGNPTNTWARLYITNVSNSDNILGAAIQAAEEIGVSQNEVVLFGVSINISKSPVVIEKYVKGFGSPIFQQYSSNGYDINIDFLESGVVFWQQNSKNISKLIDILNSGQTINIFNPQLSIVYGIDKIVATSYSIGQDPRFYSHNNISISCKSDDNVDILTPIEN